MALVHRFLPLAGLIAVVVCAAACSDDTSRNHTGTIGATAVPTETAGSTDTTPATANAIPKGVSTGTLSFAGVPRSYRLYVPANADGEPLPLLVGLHGGLGSGEQFAENSHFEQEAEQEHFIAVFPDGIGRTWNGGGCCGQAASRKIDDVGFLAALIEDLTARLPIDRDRVFMAGHSNGAIMAFRFGCERPDLVKGVASVAGSLEMPKCEPSKGTSLLAIHGDADQNHPLEGGQGPRSIANVDFTSQARSLVLWTQAMQCTVMTEPQSTGPTSVTTWTGCRDSVQAKLIIVHGADHPWPGGVAGLPDAQSRTPTAIDATAVIWEFFSGLE